MKLIMRSRSVTLPNLIVFVMTLLLFHACSSCTVYALGTCPDTPSCGGESLDHFIKNSVTGVSIPDGAVVPVNTGVGLGGLATAYGQCETTVPTCSPMPCTCEPGEILERTVNHIEYHVTAVTQGGLNGNYLAGAPTYCTGGEYHVVESWTELCPTAGGLLLAYPGIYAFYFWTNFNNYACLNGLCPYSLEKSAILYAGSESMDSTCNLMVGKGVSAANGIAATQETDFSLSGVAPIQFIRYHNSRTAQTLSRGFGNAFGHSFDTRITVIADNLHKVTNPDGTEIYYSDRNGDTIHEAIIPKGEASSLVINQDNTFERSFKDGRVEEFNSSGYLTAVVDRNGNTITLTRDSGNKLTTITNPSGRTITISYDTSNRINRITPSDGRSIDYSYSSSGALETVTYPDQHLQDV